MTVKRLQMPQMSRIGKCCCFLMLYSSTNQDACSNRYDHHGLIFCSKDLLPDPNSRPTPCVSCSCINWALNFDSQYVEMAVGMTTAKASRARLSLTHLHACTPSIHRPAPHICFIMTFCSMPGLRQDTHNRQVRKNRCYVGLTKFHYQAAPPGQHVEL